MSLRGVLLLMPVGVLLLGLVRVLRHASSDLRGDEWRYVWYAENLLEGYFTPLDNVMIWNGPGYPLVLVPFLAFGAPLLWAKLLNAVFMAGAALFVQRTLATLSTATTLVPPVRNGRALLWATAGGLFVGLSPVMSRYLHLLYTEALSLFLAAALGYCWCRGAGSKGKRLHGLLGSALLAALVMTKVIFGAVLVLGLCLSAGLLLLPRQRALATRLALTLGVAFLLCVPWLLYTQRVTGKWLYWSSGGGGALYWMASPFPEELGDWFHHRQVRDTPMLAAHHGALFARLKGDERALAHTEVEQKMPGVGRLCSPEADTELSRLALHNLSAHWPLYLRNWVYNLGRLFFDFPYTFPRPLDGWLIVPHAVLLAGLVEVLRRRAKGEVLGEALGGLAAFSLLSVGVLSLVSGMERFLIPLLPPLVLVAVGGLGRPRTGRG